MLHKICSLAVMFCTLIVACEEKPDTDSPIVSLTANLLSFTQDDTLVLSASAVDASGIATIQLYDGTMLLHDEPEASYTFTKKLTWKDNGTHIFMAQATDKSNPTNTGISNEVSIIVAIPQPDTKPPVVNLSIAPSATFSKPGDVTITATATDSSGVARLEIYEGDKLLGSNTNSPFAVTKTITAADNGTLRFTAKAIDKSSNQNTAVSTIVTLQVAIPVNDTTPPTISLVANSSTSFVTAGQLKLTATATDANGISKIEIFLGTTVVGSLTASPYIFTKNITAADNGGFVFTAKATDKAIPGNVSTSQPINVQVTIPTPDTTPPVISLTANTTSFTTSGQLKLTATTTDASGIAKVEFYQGNVFVGSSVVSPYTFTKNLTSADNGPLSFTAKAIDKAVPPNTNISNAVAIHVNIPTPDTTPPAISLTANSQLFTSDGELNLTATATDASGITRIEIYQGTSLVASSTSTSCSFTKSISTSNNGSLSFTAKAIDKAVPTNIATSTVVNIQVTISSNPNAGHSPGCGKGNSGSKTENVKINDGNTTSREVEIATSHAYQNNQGAPVVFVLHGNGGSIADARRYDFINAIQDDGDAGIVVIPQGIDWRGHGLGWDETKNGYDMPFFDNMITYVSNNYCVNTNRIYVTGFSWGGDMVNALACFRGDKFRGVANFSGGELINATNTCTSIKYPAARFRYGTSAGNGGDGSYPLAGFHEVANFYKTVLASGASTSVSPTPCVQYAGSQPFVECAILNLGHAPPSLNDAKETWKFWKNLP